MICFFHIVIIIIIYSFLFIELDYFSIYDFQVIICDDDASETKAVKMMQQFLASKLELIRTRKIHLDVR